MPSKRKSPQTLQWLSTQSLELMIRKKTLNELQEWSGNLSTHEGVQISFKKAFPCSCGCDPGLLKSCSHSLEVLSSEQIKRLDPLRDFVKDIPVKTVEDILNRVLRYGNPTEPRKASPSDIWVLVHPYMKKIIFSKEQTSDRNVNTERPNNDETERLTRVGRVIIETLKRCQYLENLNISGIDGLASTINNEESHVSSDLRERYLHILCDALCKFSNLRVLNLGHMVDNAICRTVSETCTNLTELRIRGPANVTDLGLRYIAGQVKTNTSESCDSQEQFVSRSGCTKLQILALNGIDKISLATLSILLLYLSDLRVLEHHNLHEALWLLQKAGTNKELPKLQLKGYNGSSLEQCNPMYLDILRDLCPRIENIHLCTNFRDTFISLAKFRGIKTLSIFRVASVENFDLPLMAFGTTLTKLELTNCTNFQSGTALHIRKYGVNLESLILDIDNVDANGNAGLSEAFQGEQNVHTLQHQVNDLQSRLNQLQLTMLNVMEKYGPMEKLEHLVLRNLSMGSLLIILPFAPYLKRLEMKYSQTEPDSAPNLTDELFVKIFKKNTFSELEHLDVWCQTLTCQTAEWFLCNCSKLKELKKTSMWNMSIDEQIRLWREGQTRVPNEVEVEF